jgi:DHA1 family tetracycline resistance protein-like MFS transporter
VIAPSIPTLFVAHALHGLSQCTFLIAMSAVADAAHNPNDPSSLTHAFGLIGVALGTAFVLGPILGGALAEVLGFRAIYAMSSVLFMATLYALSTFMHETLGLAARKPFAWGEAVPLRSARTVMSRSRGLTVLALAYFLCSLTVGVYTLWILCVAVPSGGGGAVALLAAGGG